MVSYSILIMGGKNMKKILPILVVGILVLSGLGAVALPSTKILAESYVKENEPNNVPLDDELDQSQTNYEEGAIGPIGDFPGMPYNNVTFAQSFIPQKEILTRVQLYMGKIITAFYPCMVAIRDNLTEENLVKVSIDPDEFVVYPNNLTWVEFNFDDIMVTIGNTYYIVAYTSNVTNNTYAWGGNNSDSYPNGTVFVSIDGGEIWENEPDADMCFMTYGRDNSPPNAPSITGETNGKAGTEYEYTFNATDPDGDPVMYFIDWGDNNTEWTEYCDSGKEITLKHTWSDKGDYIITSKAKDIYDAEGPEGTLEVTMPKNKAFNFNFNLLSWLFERFPNAFPILRHLLEL